jgi:hypothetical protein
MTDIGPADRATLHANRLPHARDAPTAHAALPPAHQRQGRGWVLHIENHQRYKRSCAEQLGHDEQGERETAGRRFAVTVLGLGLGFGLHLVSVQQVVATLGVTRVA